MSDYPGSLGGRFELRFRLGEGTFGEVWEAFDRVRDQLVAVKLLRSMTPESLYRFKREFRALAGITHPGVIRLHELFASQQRWYFCMELLRGTDLVSYARNDPRISESSSEATEPVQTCREWWQPDTDGARTHRCSSFDEQRLRLAFSQVASAIHALHLAGWIHRDLKPGNVLVTTEDRAIILDFGLVGVAEKTGDPFLNRDALVWGTPAYMAPEQAQGLNAGPASDWYSFGVMLFEVIAGRRPYQGLPEQIRKQKLSGEVPSLALIAPEAPADLRQLAEALLRARPEQRPIAAEVLGVISGRPAPVVASSVSATTTSSVFVGRETELARFDRALDRMADGTTSCVHVRGPAGHGKTSLAYQFLWAAIRRYPDAFVLKARCFENESLPYGGIDSLMDALGHKLARLSEMERATILPDEMDELIGLFPVLEPFRASGRRRSWRRSNVSVRELRSRAFRALRDLFVRLGRLFPVVVFIDDMQWAHTDTLKLLRFMLRWPPVMTLVIAYRDEHFDSEPLLKRLGAATRPDHASLEQIDVQLERFDRDESLRLARCLLPRGEASEGLSEYIARESAGIPFVIGELAQHCIENGIVSTPPKLESLLATRIRCLPPGARLLLNALAMAGKATSLELAGRLSGLRGAELLESLARLRSIRLVVLRGSSKSGSIEFLDDCVRQMALELMDAAR